MSFLDNHRGPYRFCVCRPHKTKVGFAKTEWVAGETTRDDCESEARALLYDPRDTINLVSVWSIQEECFVGGYARDAIDGVRM